MSRPLKVAGLGTTVLTDSLFMGTLYTYIYMVHFILAFMPFFSCLPWPRPILPISSYGSDWKRLISINVEGMPTQNYYYINYYYNYFIITFIIYI